MLPPAPQRRARRLRAARRRFILRVLNAITFIAALMVIAAFIVVLYRLLIAYSVRQGYGKGDVMRVSAALFLGGMIVGGFFVYLVMGGRKR